MLSRREILSPLTTPNIPGHIVTPKSNPILSPSTNRHASLQNITPLLTTEHDDEKERKERRRSKIVELQRRNLGSPSSPADRRRSAALNGLTLAQLTDHYTNCIKLSAENKINSKNAFGLHLIDYMSELLKKRELENFQVASSTLDASAKIYAGRVDAIHAETYKVLTGLGRGSEKQSDINPEGEEIDGQRHGSLEEENNMKKRKTRKNHTIETNLKNITVSKLELEFEVDPLFQMMSATFDEGGTNGLLLNNLQCYDDTQKLMLDSSSIVSPFESCMDDTEQTCSMDVNEMTDAFTLMKVEDIQICPAFANFKFTDWDGSSDTILDATSVGQSEHAFDLDAEAEPIHQPDGGSQDIYPLEDTEYNDLPDDESVSAEDCHLSDQSVQIGDGRAAQLVQIALKDMTQSSVGSLLQILAEEPSDYSYFNKALVRTWAGPSHWRLGPLSKDQRFKSCDKMMKNKTKKPTFKNDFDEEIDFDKFFKRSKSTTLTKATKSKYSKDQTTLPKDLHYEADKLFRVFRKPNLMIKRQNDNLPVDDEIQNYDYENANDRDNYCPNNFEADDEAGNDDDMENFTQGFGEFTQDTSQDLFSSINPSGLEHDLTLNGTLAGDQLVSQPYKVTKINIAYAKTAKRLDVKRVKTAMWDLLSQSEDANMTKGSTSMETPRKEKNMTETQAFQHLLKELPVKLSDQMARNLSVPIAFVCLLHLANEKTLKILAREDMSDLQISQGI